MWIFKNSCGAISYKEGNYAIASGAKEMLLV